MLSFPHNLGSSGDLSKYPELVIIEVAPGKSAFPK
jgi:hypothetical protein